jgi:hypothetical protein
MDPINTGKATVWGDCRQWVGNACGTLKKILPSFSTCVSTTVQCGAAAFLANKFVTDLNKRQLSDGEPLDTSLITNAVVLGGLLVVSTAAKISERITKGHKFKNPLSNPLFLLTAASFGALYSNQHPNLYDRAQLDYQNEKALFDQNVTFCQNYINDHWSELIPPPPECYRCKTNGEIQIVHPIYNLSKELFLTSPQDNYISDHWRQDIRNTTLNVSATDNWPCDIILPPGPQWILMAVSKMVDMSKMSGWWPLHLTVFPIKNDGYLVEGFFSLEDITGDNCKKLRMPYMSACTTEKYTEFMANYIKNTHRPNIPLLSDYPPAELSYILVKYYLPTTTLFSTLGSALVVITRIKKVALAITMNPQSV